MVVSVKEMHAGRGVGYLMNTIADIEGGNVDGTAISHMTAYFATEGTPPGTWLGKGLSGLGHQISAGKNVTLPEMEALLGNGRDPVTDLPLGQALAKQLSQQERIDARVRRIPKGVQGEDRVKLIEKIRVEEQTRKVPKAVTGFDFVFSPSKSISVLWAVADHGVREQIYEAHYAALNDAIGTIEDRVAMTRVGTNGVAQVETRGIIAAAFDHWDARGGDPQLHTHVTIANRVQGKADGKWRTLDSRGALFPSVVMISELYDSRLRDHLTQKLGVEWEEQIARSGSKSRRFEIKGVPRELVNAFSSRGRAIEEEKDRLVGEYRKLHGRSPSVTKIIQLREQAQRSTRPSKKLVPLAELQQRWREKAQTLGVSPRGLVRDSTSRRKPSQLLRFDDFNSKKLRDELDQAIDATWDELRTNFAVWKTTNATAAAMRATAHIRMSTNEDRLRIIDHIVEEVATRAIEINSDSLDHTPSAFVRSDGQSAFSRTGAQLFTSPELLQAEQNLLGLSRTHSGPTVAIDTAAAWAAAPVGDTGRTLTVDQGVAMEQIAASGRIVDVLVGPAGAGKTTMLNQMRTMWEDAYGPGSVKGLAPSAAAAAVLGDELAIATDNTAKWIDVHNRNMPEWRKQLITLSKQLRNTTDLQQRRIVRAKIDAVNARIDQWTLRPGQLLIVDEASLAGTHALHELAQQAERAGAKLLLVGDWAQLAAVEAGGAFGLLVRDREGTAPELGSIHRFRHDWEKHASIQLRTGQSTVLDTYATHGRIHEGTLNSQIDHVFESWRTDVEAGKQSLMIGPDNETVAALNTRARLARINAGHVREGGVELHDATRASVGDQIVTRENDRQLALSRNSWVKNGDQWTVVSAHQDGSLTVRRLHGERSITLPATYVSQSVELAYATTAHRAQGSTVDTAHAIATDSLSREVLYVAMTRGREANHVYVATPDTGDAHDTHVADTVTGMEVLTNVLSRTGAALSAHETARDAYASVHSLARLVDEYETIAQYATATKWETHTRRAVPGVDEGITHHELWSGYVAIMRHIEAHGIDTDRVLSTMSDGVMSADDPFAELHGRVAAVASRVEGRAQQNPRSRIAGIITPVTTTDTDLARGLAERHAHIEREVHARAVQLRENPEPWMKKLGARSGSPDRVQLWDQTLEGVVAYRMLYEIVDPTIPLGNKRDASSWKRHSHYGRAKQLITTLRETPKNPTASSITQQVGIDQ